MARLLVTHPYHLALDAHEARLARPYPPLATLVSAGALREAGHQVVFHDPMFEADPSRFGAVLDRAGPIDAVAILGDDHSVSMKQCLGAVRRAQQRMAADAAGRGLPVLVAGPDVSDHADAYIAAGASAAVVGDAAQAAVQWVAALDSGAAVQGVHGLCGAGGRRHNIEDLDSLPVAARDLVDLGEYARRWRRRHGLWELNVWTARGCPYRCNWCAKPTWGRTYHVRSPDRVAEELAQLVAAPASLRPDRIWFTDDIFALRPAWLRSFRRAVVERDAVLPYRCLSRGDLLKDPAYVADLAASGCDEVWLGAESGSDRVLRAMDKDGTVAEIRRATALLHQHGVSVGFFLQLGYPGEQLEDVRKTIEMVAELRPDDIGVSVSYPLPGTVFHERVGGPATHWDGSMENRPLHAAPYGAAFYGAAKEVLRSQHSAGRARLAVRGFLASPGRRSARRVLGAAWHRARLPWMRRRMERLAVPDPNAVPLTW